jgi:hypothetical protein
MKIIEKKDWESTWSARFDCSQCESKLEAEANDLLCGTGNGNCYVYCPVCQLQLAISNVPPYLKKLAKQRTTSASYGYYGYR